MARTDSGTDWEGPFELWWTKIVLNHCSQWIAQIDRKITDQNNWKKLIVKIIFY